MAVISVVGQKGGIGKSTLCFNLADELHRRGKKVLLIDADRQGTLLHWRARAFANDRQDAPPVVPVLKTEEILRLVPSNEAKHDVIIIDSPGRNDRICGAAIMVADLVLLPVPPSPVDLDSMQDTIDLVRDLESDGVAVNARFVVLRDKRTTTYSKLIRDVLAQHATPVLRSTLSELIDYSKSYQFGEGVTRFAPGSKAAREIEALTNELLATLETLTIRGEEHESEARA